MRIPYPFWPKIFLALAPLALAGCSGDADRADNIAVIGDQGSLFIQGPRLPLGAQFLRNATVEGLVGFDAQGRVIPALADRWIVTDDGQSYIFRLRDGTWPDGSAITADGAGTALRRAIAQLGNTPLARDLGDIAEVRVMAGRVVELRLSRPVPDLLQLLAQPELGLAYKGRGSGPMALSRKSRIATLKPIAPEKRGMPAQEGWKNLYRNLQVQSLPAEKAIASFDNGDVDVVLGGKIEQFPRTKVAGISRGNIRLDPVIGLFGLSVVHADGFLSNPENREAIAMAIDRDSLITPFGVGGWAASTRIVSPGIAGDTGAIGERWQGQGLDQRRAVAAGRVTHWQASHPDPEALRIAMPGGPGSELLFERLASDFKAIGLSAKRVGEDAAADLRLIDIVARYPRPIWFLNQLGCAGRQDMCSSSADFKVARARQSTTAADYAEQLVDAEAELTKANVYIPFGPPIRWSLVRADATGFAENSWGFHPLMPMATRPK